MVKLNRIELNRLKTEVSGGPALRRRLRFLLKWSYALATIFANDQFRPE
jgi:hypothetical protein